VLLCLGGNDMLRKHPESATENNLRLLVQTIRASGADVVLIGVPEPKLFGGAPDFYARVADELKLPLEDEVFVEVLKDNRLKADPIHANAAGYRVVAERLNELLREAGAL
jgi:lysophospholipase L1-like esterase